MKKALSLALAAAMAASLAACGGSPAASTASSAATTDTAASGAASAGGQTLKVMLSEEPGEGDAFATTLNKWADETGNTVDIMVIPYDDQLTKFPLMAKNNDLPDLLSTPAWRGPGQKHTGCRSPACQWAGRGWNSTR